MKRYLLLMALGAFGCSQAPEEQAAAPVSAMPNESVVGQEAQSKAPLVVPLPTDQKELDQLILAGYTPHGEHLHPPGVKNCPLANEGKEAVM